jgi:hypothetical protein
MPAPELLRHLSTMATGELLQSDLTGRAKFVGANDRVPTDEGAEIDTREVLSASWTHRRVRDVARRMHDGTEPLIARQSPNLGTPERRTESVFYDLRIAAWTPRPLLGVRLCRALSRLAPSATQLKVDIG